MEHIDFSRLLCFHGYLRDLHDNNSIHARDDRRFRLRRQPHRPDGLSEFSWKKGVLQTDISGFIQDRLRRAVTDPAEKHH